MNILPRLLTRGHLTLLGAALLFGLAACQNTGDAPASSPQEFLRALYSHYDGKGPGAVTKMVASDTVAEDAFPYGHTVRPQVAGGATLGIAPVQGARTSLRVGPAVFGRGYMEAIADAEIERVEAEQAAEAAAGGAVSGRVLNEGLYFRVPLMDSVVLMDVKIQKEEVVATAASKDLQTVNSKVALNYQIDPQKVANIYQDIGTDYNPRLIDPALQESVKATTAKYTSEELSTKREEVRYEIKAHLGESDSWSWT